MGLALVALVGCVSYTPQPLPETAHAPAPAHLALDMEKVAHLAVANNPKLQVARDAAGIARAQAFAAGLLPDPQLGLTYDQPTNGGPGNTTGFTAGLSADVAALVTRQAATAAAEAHERQVNLDLMWQEWQVASRARLLFVRSLEERRLLSILRENRALFAERYARTQRALDQGNTTLDAASADLAALQTVERQINELERRRNRNRLDLNVLLGLAPATQLELVGGAPIRLLDAAQVRRELARFAQRRPDLLALRAGYESQDQRFRQAVLAQFPSLNVGIARARDTSGLYTAGLGVTLSLPVFNRNRGNIAIERATRQRLYDEYRQRLDAAETEVRGLLDDQALLERQLRGVRGSLAELERTVAGADAAYRDGNLSEPAYARLQAAMLAKRIEAVTLEQNILEQRVALQTLLGTELPTTVRPEESNG